MSFRHVPNFVRNSHELFQENKSATVASFARVRGLRPRVNMGEHMTYDDTLLYGVGKKGIASVVKI